MKKIIIALIICVSFAFANLSFAGRVDTSEYPPQEDVEQDPPPVEDTTQDPIVLEDIAPLIEDITPPTSGDITKPSLEDIAQNPPPDVVEHEHTPPIVEEPVPFCEIEMTDWEKEQLFKQLYVSIIEGYIVTGYSFVPKKDTAFVDNPAYDLALDALKIARDLLYVFRVQKKCVWKNWDN